VPALEPAVPTRADVIRDLVNRGYIPRQSLDTTLPTRDDVMRDLDWVDGVRTIDEVFADIDAEWATLESGVDG
jgi:hypothetical protein